MTLSRNPTDEEFLKYTKFIGIFALPLRWNKVSESALASLRQIVIPSHILIDSNGTVIKTFPGTSIDQRIRDRMAREVLRQVLDEHKTRKSHGAIKAEFAQAPE
jgi:hypothetical protein